MTPPAIRAVSLPNGGIVSALGLGTFGHEPIDGDHATMGEQRARRATEFAAPAARGPRG